MALSAELSLRLDASALVQSFTAALGSDSAALTTIAVPDSSSGIAVEAFDPASLAPLLARINADGSTRLAALGAPADLFGGLAATLDLVEQLAADELSGGIESLLAQLSQELEGTRDGGVFGVLLRLSALLGSSPQAGTLATLLQALLARGGVALPPAVNQAADLLPALHALVRAAGGLMMLESVLEESERLTGVMAGRLDAADVRRQFDQLLALADPALALRTAAAAAEPAAMQAVAAALTVLADRSDALQLELSSGLGQGEATLAYLGVQQVQGEVAAAAALLRDIDLAALERLMRSALGGLGGGAFDFSRAPAQSLDALLTQAEAQVAAVAGMVASWQPAELVEPLTEGIATLTAPLAEISQIVETALVTMRAAMESVRQVVAALPLAELAGAITTLLEPVTRAIALVTDLVAAIGAALAAAAVAAVDALEAVETTLDGFKAELQAAFAEARAFVEGLNLDAVAGQLSGRIGEFTQALAQAQLKPYFDTAVDAIGGAADVVDAVPFGLLPESMKAELDAAVAPIKAVDLEAFATEVEAMVGIGPDGSFQPRADLEAAIAGIQARFDVLVQTLREHDPQQYLEQLDTQLAALAARIAEIAPAVTLQPVQDAIAGVKAALARFDIDVVLAPVQDVFDQAITALQPYAPGTLIAPLEERMAAARGKLVEAIRIDQWAPALDTVHAQAAKALALVDPARLESQLAALLEQARGLVALIPDSRPQWLGTVIAALHQGTPARIHPHTIVAVQHWVADGGGAAELTARSGHIADSVARTHAAVSGIDIAALSGMLVARLAPLRIALAGLVAALPADAPERAELAALLPRLDVQFSFGRLVVNRERYLALLTSALPLGATLARTGLSEVDTTVAKLRSCLQPVSAVTAILRGFVRAAGLAQVDAGVPAMFDALFAAAPPARLAAMTAPIFNAVRDRVQVLIDAVIVPLKNAVAQLQGLIAAFDLAPLREAADAVFQQALAELRALSPAALLAAPIGAVNTLQAELAAFDPLAALIDVLDTLRDTAARLTAKLSAAQLLEDPVAIYREIVDAIDALNVSALITPVLELLDSIARDVDTGLDDAVAAFQRLQDALPAGGGSSVAVEVVV